MPNHDSGDTPSTLLMRTPRGVADDAATEPSPAPAGKEAAVTFAVDPARYVENGRLGEGGMGEVLSALDQQIGRAVAVKRLREQAMSDDNRRRLVREARVQGRLEHPAVVPVHDLGIDPDGHPYFVMKRVTGLTMTEVVNRAIDPALGAPDMTARRRLWRAFVDVCLAVEFAHHQGVIHRDLKPSNIMLGDFGEVYVLDWGIARGVGIDPDEPREGPLVARTTPLDGSAETFSIAGTPGYMPPEQAVGEVVGPTADIFALGCILFEISTGRHLYPAGNALATALEIDARPSQVVADSPPEIDVICVRATRSDPTERFTSARDMANAVQAFLDGDRDVVLRRSLAAADVREASALKRTHPAERGRLMRLAGRALALDPTSRDAGELVARLMLEPAAEVPPEVEQRMLDLDLDTNRIQGPRAALSLLGSFFILPFLLWSGVRDWTPIIAAWVLTLASAAHVLTISRHATIPLRHVYLNVALNAAMAAMVARVTGPFLITPIVVVTMIMSYAVNPRLGRMWVVCAIFSCAIAVPWLLEGLDLVEPTFHIKDGTLVHTFPALELHALPAAIVFAMAVAMQYATIAALCRTGAARQRASALQVEVAAWQVRQLVPALDAAATSPPA